MQLEEIMQLSAMDKRQLIELCNALYELLQQRTVQAPVFIPSPYTPQLPTYPTWFNGAPQSPYQVTVSNESTQQERFGVK
jgi:hypothetical protein